VLDNVQVTYDPAVTRLTRAGLVRLVPGSTSNQQRVDELAGDQVDLTSSHLGAVGSWQSPSSGTQIESQNNLLFNLNDFLGESQPLEVVAWCEEQ